MNPSDVTVQITLPFVAWFFKPNSAMPRLTAPLALYP